MTGGALRRDELASIFAGCGDRGEMIGLEVECGLVDPLTGKSVRPDDEFGGGALLAKVADEFGLESPPNEPHPLSVGLLDGGVLSLEMGGALEYSSAPGARLTDVVDETRATLSRVSVIADSLGIALLPGGLLPFTPMSDIPWIRKPRVRIMRSHFSRLGPPGSLADGVMGLALSTQTSLDYRSPDDLVEKLHLLVAASPVLAALFVNSPIEEGLPSGALSRRMQCWRRTDPLRCGFQGWALTSQAPALDIIERMLDLPMIYHREHDGHGADGAGGAGRRSFRDLIDVGFDDGRFPDLTDWRLHLSQVWPQVRVREFLEMRAFDCPPWESIAAAPAILTGLVYDRDSRTRARALLAGFTAQELDAAGEDVALRGLDAMLGEYRVNELARELLRLARRGLEARVAAGLDGPEILGYLTAVQEVADTGVTFADAVLARWTDDFDKRPDHYVDAYRVPR